jgi:hypothetical protein
MLIIWVKNLRANILIVLFGLFGATLGLTANFISPRLDHTTARPLAEILKPQLHDDDMVVAYKSYWQDLPVYLKRNIIVAGWQGELGFGMEHYPYTHEWMIETETFWTRCAASKTRVYVFMKEEDWKVMVPSQGCRLREMGRYGKTLLLTKE